MSIAQILQATTDVKSVEQLAERISCDASLSFEELFECLHHTDKRIVWRTAWVLTKLAKYDGKYLFEEEHIIALMALAQSPRPIGFIRMTLSILSHLDVATLADGIFVETLFSLLTNPRKPIAIRAYSMKIIENIGEEYPEILSELLLCLEQLDFDQSSKGLVATKRNILRRQSAKKNKKIRKK